MKVQMEIVILKFKIKNCNFHWTKMTINEIKIWIECKSMKGLKREYDKLIAIEKLETLFIFEIFSTQIVLSCPFGRQNLL
jgi:hypothetical protein